MAESVELTLADAAATVALGERLARAVCAAALDGLTLYLTGDLGAGKTTFARGFLQGLGHRGRVPSPTYTLIEPYQLGTQRVFHIDLYRIRDPLELDDLGLADLLTADAISLIEWPDHGAGHLPAPDVGLYLRIEGDGRVARIEVMSARGDAVMAEGGSTA